ncbi:MAG: hypothetical protein KJ630_22460 [Proteobacteria bacterium]|nr:hypothetical protein [Pseudomonadota bacterium]
MLLNSWAIALLVSAAAAFFLLGGAIRTAIRVLFSWAPEQDTAVQIALENETWLAALLVRYGMVLQLASLLLLVLAADSFSHILIGAMCATGAFVANDYGMPALIFKLFGVFFYGFWLVLHRLDIRSEFLPLTRIKFAYLLLLGPLLCADITLLVLYLINLKPDIITSCCGVVFAAGGAEDGNLLGPLPTPFVMLLFYSTAAALVLLALFLQRSNRTADPMGGMPVANFFFGTICLFFFILSLVVITVVISPYIYALPSHRCPFDFLRVEYYCVGYPIYLTLMLATFAGISCAATSFLQKLPGLAIPVCRFRQNCLRVFLLLLPVFLALVSWFPINYVVKGGE